MDHVFILGFSRTGSTMLQHILNKYTEAGIIPEMHLSWPRILHKDFKTIFKENFGKTISDSQIYELIQLMYSKRLQGLFWQKIEKNEIDLKELKLNLQNCDRTFKGIVDALFLTMNKTFKKRVVGAKFPVHFTHADILLKWYPNCKLIHTIRDPRAIFVSQYYKYKNEKKPFYNLFVGLSQFVHVNYSLKKAYEFHNNFKSSNNYYLYKYEEVMIGPEKEFKKLCRYLRIKYNPDMIKPEIFRNTSLSKKSKIIGIQKNSIKSWETRLPALISKIITMIHKEYMNEFKYV